MIIESAKSSNSHSGVHCLLLCLCTALSFRRWALELHGLGQTQAPLRTSFMTLSKILNAPLVSGLQMGDIIDFISKVVVKTTEYPLDTRIMDTIH